jgi:hypothetical protein
VFVVAVGAEHTNGEIMKQLGAIVRRDFLVLALYCGLIFVAQIVEAKLVAPTAAMSVYILSSIAYVVGLVKNHRVKQETTPRIGPKLQHIGICLTFVIAGLCAGVVFGVNAKFFLGGTI